MNASVMIRKFFFRILLLAENRNPKISISAQPTFMDKLRYWFEVTPFLSGFCWMLDGIDLWIKTNHQFVTFVTIAVIINIVYGMYYHHKTNTFDYGELIRKACKMIVTILVSYVLLDMLRVTAGENIAGEVFKIMIQVMTLLYPISKTLKQVYILSNKEFPPEFIMTKLYNFEKGGDLTEFFKTTKDIPVVEPTLEPMPQEEQLKQ